MLNTLNCNKVKTGNEVILVIDNGWTRVYNARTRVLVGRCLATKVFIGKLPAAEWM